MDIYELDSYRLSDAVKFHTELNPALWDGKTMRPEVREALLKIADDFKTFMGIDDLALEDITVSGSNAAFSYTPHSDIDLHLLVDFSKLNPDEVYQELFNAKKYQYNDQHDIKIRGYDVELYVQDSNKPVRSLGEYSLVKDDWTRIPVQRRGNLDEKSTQSKYEKLKGLIELATNSNSFEQVTAVTDTIKKYRQAGLDEHGEFGPENLAYKMLRTQGYVERLFKHKADLEDARLSLDERKKKKKKKKTFKYGAFGGVYFPGYHYYGQSDAAADGGGDGGGESMRESTESQQDIIERFTRSCADLLGIETVPEIKLRRDPQWTKINGTFGRYTADPDHRIELATHGRHIVDILRTLAHEMTHARQSEVTGLPDDAGETGSEYEDSANAMAGRIMRHWAESEPHMFQGVELEEGLGKTLATGALAAAAALGQPAQAQDVGRTAYQIGKQIYQPSGIFTRAGAEEEIKGMARDLARDIRTGGSSAKFLGRTILARPVQGSERVAANGVGATPEAAYQDALTRAYTDANRRYGPISVGDWRPVDSEKEIEQVGGQYRAAVVLQGPAPVREASGYIPTKEQARDPRFKTALTVDIRPGQTGKEANKLGLQTDSQGRPDLLMKNLANALREFKETGEFEPINEVRMSPSSLEAWARSPEAEGIRAGFEAEMIFRNTKRDDDEGEMEPDYDYDERADDIDHVIDFFSNDDWGYGLSGRDARGLRETLWEEFNEWVQEKIDEEWDPEEQVKDYMDTNVWGDDSEKEERINSVLERNDIDPDEATDEQKANAEETAEDEYLEEVEQAANDSSSDYYQQAYEYYSDMKREGGDYDEREFLRDRHGYMSDIANSNSLDWPYWTGGGSGGGDRDWEDIGNSLQSAVDMPVKVSGNYHSATRRPGLWIIEPDGSLDPDDGDDMGLEIVSPPLPLNETLEKLKAVIEWGNNEADAYTNSTTGLHMGISIPYVGGDVDYVKLVLFMGDEYILDKFGRASNTYAASAMGKLRQSMGGARQRGDLTEAKFDPMSALELVQKNLIELAARYVQNGVGTSKYTSAHIQDGYIEFRSPGGDYLSMESRGEYDDIKNTMLRFARAMQIAGNPSLERREYAKKLYQLISPGAQDDGLTLFSQFAAGVISPEQLKKQWADAVLKKEIPTMGQEEWEIYDQTKSGPESVTNTLYANDYDDAYRKAQRMLGGSIPGALDIRKKQPWFDVFDPEGNIVDTFRARDIDYAQDKAKSDHYDEWTDAWKVYRRPDNTPEPEKKLSRRAEVAKRIKEPKVTPKVAADNAQDSQEIQARIGEPQPAGAVRDTGYYRVTWRELRGSGMQVDSLNINAANANAAMDNVRSALQAQGREIIGIEAHIQNPPAWRQPASTPQNTQGEFTGEWQVRDSDTNDVLYTFSGVGNLQGDANRVAARWLRQNAPEDADMTDVTVVPVMR
jgi:hypothetical protein